MRKSELEVREILARFMGWEIVEVTCMGETTTLYERDGYRKPSPPIYIDSIDAIVGILVKFSNGRNNFLDNFAKLMSKAAKFSTAYPAFPIQKSAAYVMAYAIEKGEL